MYRETIAAVNLGRQRPARRSASSRLEPSELAELIADLEPVSVTLDLPAPGRPEEPVPLDQP